MKRCNRLFMPLPTPRLMLLTPTLLPWSVLGGALWSAYTCILAYKVATNLAGIPLASVVISGLVTTAALAVIFVVVRKRRATTGQASQA